MSFGVRRRKFMPKPEVRCECDHPHIAHYTKDGHCVFPGCGCSTFRPAGRPEFSNKKAECRYGHAHNSGLEIKICFDLHCLLVAKEIKKYEAEKVVDLWGPSGHTIAAYKVDFIVEHLDGVTEFIEAKGAHLMTKQPWPLKWSLLQDKHRGDPKFKFTVVKE